MTNFGDMQDRLTDELMVAASSTLFTTTRIKDLLNDAYMWASALYEWPQLQKAYDTVLPTVETSTNEQYIDYPEDYRTDTMKEFIYVDGSSHKRKAWSDFLEYKRLNPSGRKKIFADYGRQVFFWPHGTPGAEVCLWGQRQATKLVSDSDETIFSNHDESGNEAIVRKALSTALRRVDSALSVEEEKAAVTLLSIIWKKVQDRQQYAQPLNKSMFSVPDFFRGNQATFRPRNFDWYVDYDE